MFDDNDSMTAAEASVYQGPPPPRFDAQASAAAQPVQPLTRSGPARWLQRAGDAHKTLAPPTKALLIVIIAGLVMGAAGGAMLAKRNDSATGAALIEESRIEAAVAGRALEDTPSAMSADASAMALAYPNQPERIRRDRSWRRRGAPRAYRFAIIK